MISKLPHRRSAFTLLEVALVTVIIFLLILALIPAFRGKRAEKRYPVLPAATPTPGKAVATPAIPILPAGTPVPLPVDPANPPAPPEAAEPAPLPAVPEPAPQQ